MDTARHSFLLRPRQASHGLCRGGARTEGGFWVRCLFHFSLRHECPWEGGLFSAAWSVGLVVGLCFVRGIEEAAVRTGRDVRLRRRTVAAVFGLRAALYVGVCGRWFRWSPGVCLGCAVAGRRCGVGFRQGEEGLSFFIEFVRECVMSL